MDDKEKAAALSIYLSAIDDYFKTGNCTTCCHKCGGIIEIRPVGETAWKVSCSCGRFNDTLRGL